MLTWRKEKHIIFDTVAGHKHDGTLARQTAHADLGGITSDNHHPQLHALTHVAAGTDEITSALNKDAIPPISGITYYWGLSLGLTLETSMVSGFRRTGTTYSAPETYFIGTSTYSLRAASWRFENYVKFSELRVKRAIFCAQIRASGVSTDHGYIRLYNKDDAVAIAGSEIDKTGTFINYPDPIWVEIPTANLPTADKRISIEMRHSTDGQSVEVCVAYLSLYT